MSASKAVLKFAQSVVVDTSESLSLPLLVKETYLKGGATIPIVIFTDPGMKTVYGSFNHPQMKSQNYAKIFKATRRKIAEALKAGEFSFGEGNEPVVLKVSDAQMEDWKSAQGKTIRARLVAIEDEEIFIFETEKKKTIRAQASQLSKESVARARELASSSADD